VGGHAPGNDNGINVERNVRVGAPLIPTLTPPQEDTFPFGTRNCPKAKGKVGRGVLRGTGEVRGWEAKSGRDATHGSIACVLFQKTRNLFIVYFKVEARARRWPLGLCICVVYNMVSNIA